MNPRPPGPCPICQGHEWTYQFRVESEEIHQCGKCGLLGTGPSKDPSALAALYEVGFYEEGAKRFRMSLADKIMRWFRGVRARNLHRLLNGPARILDIGCGRGFTLAALRDLGHEVHGTQLSREAVTFARSHLALEHIEQRDLFEIHYPDGWFDAITVYHVLEHVHDPIALLKEIRRILKPDGLFIVEIPHAGGVGARLFGRFWLGWDVPYHRYHFTQATLDRALTESGFRVEGYSFPVIEYAPAVLTLSALNALTGSENHLFRALSYTGKVAVQLGRMKTVFHLSLAACLFVPSLITAVIESLSGRGEIISAQCRKIVSEQPSV